MTLPTAVSISRWVQPTMQTVVVEGVGRSGVDVGRYCPQSEGVTMHV
ncbi:hypothetical protein [Deinococcus rubellus]|uniref:Uncharacterized protein n=1 Tax=Deinococcus rubellus TaxID=1889240 RepID=A0ABY5YE98_9DEIO|nr:hypothetical protein [Deinococcus rubellus]UWX63031.1 hypothetical protein N0D28_09675 [Deinococcus rubellus]